MNKMYRWMAVLAFVALGGTACVPSPLFVRDSAYDGDDMKFLVSDGETQYVVKCDWEEVGGELQNCRKLDVTFNKQDTTGGGQ